VDGKNAQSTAQNHQNNPESSFVAMPIAQITNSAVILAFNGRIEANLYQPHEEEHC
jgi:hypothetical protein